MKLPPLADEATVPASLTAMTDLCTTCETYSVGSLFAIVVVLDEELALVSGVPSIPLKLAFLLLKIRPIPSYMDKTLILSCVIF